MDLVPRNGLKPVIRDAILRKEWVIYMRTERLYLNDVIKTAYGSGQSLRGVSETEFMHDGGSILPICGRRWKATNKMQNLHTGFNMDRIGLLSEQWQVVRSEDSLGGSILLAGKVFQQCENEVTNNVSCVRSEMIIYGRENESLAFSYVTTRRLATMERAIRSINDRITHGGNFNNYFPGFKADFILANPPFNISDRGGEHLRDDKTGGGHV